MTIETERVENSHARRMKVLPTEDPRRIAMIAAMQADVICRLELL